MMNGCLTDSCADSVGASAIAWVMEKQSSSASETFWDNDGSGMKVEATAVWRQPPGTDAGIRLKSVDTGELLHLQGFSFFKRPYTGTSVTDVTQFIIRSAASPMLLSHSLPLNGTTVIDSMVP